jgi:peptidoglycan/LPS O-acetylase OafA/YrhL
LDKLASDPGVGAFAPKPLAHHEFRPDINGLRALAVLAVLAFHAGLPAPGGFAGVDIFFVISGFLISRIILSERAADDFSLLGFYGKRVKRILPALLLVLFSSWVASWFLLDPDDFRRFGGHMEGSSYFSVNLWLYRQAFGPGAYFNPAARYWPLLHLWSLSIEEQFYLIWPALLLILFKARRFLAQAIGLVFLISLIYCIFRTAVDSTGAFFLLSTRAWELALGAMLAQREVFADPAPPSAHVANIRAGLGVILMLGSVWLFTEASPWPGYLALAPTIGCALVIAAPGARISEILLGNRVAQFFGLISYPLYLWHWPLFSIAHNRFGDHLPNVLVAALLGLSVLLAYLTWRFAEAPIAAVYKRKPLTVAAILLAGLALAGLVGSVTRSHDGFPQRFPANVNVLFNYRAVANQDLTVNSECADGRMLSREPLEDERAEARRFYVEKGCLKISHPDRPTVVVVGDSHAMHLVRGLRTVYGDRINLVVMGAGGCAPLIAQTEPRPGFTGVPRCQAINEEIVRNIIALKPDAIVVAAFFSEFYYGYLRYFPQFLTEFDANVAALRQAGVHSPILIMGQVPTWAPSVPSLVGRDLLAGRKPSEISRENLNPENLELDMRLASRRWTENVFYVSQAARLCGAEGCRRLVGGQLPEGMISMDYGHYTPAGSNYAVKTILAPVLDPVLAAAQARKAN